MAASSAAASSATSTHASTYIHYEVDDEEVATALQLAEYGGEDESSWVLLEPVALAAAAGQSVRERPLLTNYILTML